VREQRPARCRAETDFASGGAREENVAADDERLRADRARRETREGSRMESGRGGQSDWRSVADDLRSVE